MSILNNKQPDAPYDRVQAALDELDPADREELIDVLLNNRGYTRKTIAEYLNEQTGHKHDINRTRVTHYRDKLMGAKA